MKIDISILLNKIHGELDEQEKQAFESWIDSDSRHRAYFDHLRHRELEPDNPEHNLSEEQYAAYRQLFISTVKPAEKERKNQKRQLFYAVSAVASVLIIISIILFTKENEKISRDAVFAETPEEIEVKEPVPFAKEPKVTNNKVRLVTAKGEKISLYDIDPDKYSGTQAFQLSNDKTSLIYSSTNTEKSQGLNTLFVERGAEFKITLGDGTKIHLNSDSKLEYPTAFDADERRVTLQGEAYFEVAANDDKPFIVCIGSTEIKVLGTEFNINSRQTECVRTTLVSGSVAVKSAKTEEIRLEPGFTATLNPITGSVDISDKDIECYIGWKTGNYVFERTSLSDILNELAIWYDLRIDYQTTQADEETFTGSLSRNLSINRLIQLIERTNHLSLELKGKKIIVRDRETAGN